MTGLIAFFDILGYKSFLKNNPGSASKTAEDVLNFIQNKPKEVIESLAKAYNEASINPQLSADISSRTTPLIFSDSIILSIEYPDKSDAEWKEHALFFLSASSTYLCTKMFDYGLPLRGAMVEGEFLINKNCFAGKAIVDAYQLGESLDLAGFVIDRNLNDFVVRLIEKQIVMPSFFVWHLTPTKTDGEVNMFHTNWLPLHSQNRIDFIASDIEKYVLRSFWDHGKECPKALDAKIANTCKLLRKFVIMNDIQLNRNPK